jgi:hypothetical protein
LPTWLTNGLLLLASGVLCALAGASAWLSYHAQVAYVLAHNGDQVAEARVWALLLDAGTAGVSLLRLYETLRRQTGTGTRISLLGCITASVTMNVLHAASHSLGGLVVAAVPPLMYTAFLEHLLANLRGLLTGDEKRRTVLRALVLWVNFPALMWRRRRGVLRREVEHALTVPDCIPCAADAAPSTSAHVGGEVGEGTGTAGELGAERLSRPVRRGRGPGAKRIAFEAALVEQVRRGDLRLFCGNERERNAAAYQAAASLPIPLSRGAARRYVVQALPRLGVANTAGGAPVPESA